MVEPVCVAGSNRAACHDFRQAITVPGVGAYVSVTGVHVLDTTHGWMELHPVTDITVIR